MILRELFLGLRALTFWSDGRSDAAAMTMLMLGGAEAATLERLDDGLLRATYAAADEDHRLFVASL